jgi:guanylate cyclase
MEHTCLPNAIQVTQQTQQILQDAYVFSEKSSIEVKGKGAVDAFLLLSHK